MRQDLVFCKGFVSDDFVTKLTNVGVRDWNHDFAWKSVNSSNPLLSRWDVTENLKSMLQEHTLQPRLSGERSAPIHKLPTYLSCKNSPPHLWMRLTISHWAHLPPQNI